MVYRVEENVSMRSLLIGYSGIKPLRKWILSLLFIPMILYFIGRHGKYSLVDSADLIIHEAGHFFFGFMGNFIQAAGGTLMQILFPSFLSWYFFQNGYRTGFQIFILWLGQNLLNISVYVADAPVRRLPLLGNGKHDWYYLLGQLNLLDRANEIATIFYFLGIVLFAIAVFIPLFVEEPTPYCNNDNRERALN